ncbi:HAD-IIA family hydrolase [Arthrobacter monumenti]
MTGQALISSYDALLADLDGVVYAGPAAIDGAVESLKRLADFDVGLGYITNNASRSPATVAEHLRSLGAPATEEQIITSAQAGARLLAERLKPGSTVLVAGSKALAAEVELVGMSVVWSAEEQPDAVVQGFDPGIGWTALAEASFAVAGGALWVATNTDMTVPNERGIAPGNGSLVAAVQAATGQVPDVAGKPRAPLFSAAVERLQAEHALIVGDRLDTDILGGNNSGIDTAVVLTGVDTRETILAARAVERPQYILADLRGLFEPYPDIEISGDKHSCGGSTAYVEGSKVQVTGSLDDLDTWRAACSAWWAANPDAEEALSPTLVD